MGLTIRPIAPPDLDDFSRFVVGLYADDPGGYPMSTARARRQAMSMIDRPDRVRLLIIEMDAVPVGHAILVPYWSNEFGGEIMWLDEMYIVPTHRHRGIGTALLARLQHWAEQEGWFRIELEAHRRNQAALKVYANAGFEVEDRVLCGWQRVRPE
jgi:GNAT superfamily N-acetyltransferase